MLDPVGLAVLLMLSRTDLLAHAGLHKCLSLIIGEVQANQVMLAALTKQHVGLHHQLALKQHSTVQLSGWQQPCHCCCRIDMQAPSAWDCHLVPALPLHG